MLRPVDAPSPEQTCRCGKAKPQDVGLPYGVQWEQVQKPPQQGGGVMGALQGRSLGRLHTQRDPHQKGFHCQPAQACNNITDKLTRVSAEIWPITLDHRREEGWWQRRSQEGQQGEDDMGDWMTGVGVSICTHCLQKGGGTLVGDRGLHLGRRSRWWWLEQYCVGYIG